MNFTKDSQVPVGPGPPIGTSFAEAALHRIFTKSSREEMGKWFAVCTSRNLHRKFIEDRVKWHGELPRRLNPPSKLFCARP